MEGYERPHLSLLIRAEDLAAAGTVDDSPAAEDPPAHEDTAADSPGRHWINGGTTDSAHLVLLCAHHYRITTGPSAARGRKRLARWWGLRSPDLHGVRVCTLPHTSSIHSRPRPSCQTSR